MKKFYDKLGNLLLKGDYVIWEGSPDDIAEIDHFIDRPETWGYLYEKTGPEAYVSTNLKSSFSIYIPTNELIKQTK